MTDPFDSLRPPRRALPAGGDDRAITRGRRVLHRRRAAYGSVVGAGLVAVGAVAVLDQGGSGRDSIRYLDPDPSSTPGASGSPGAATPTPTALPDPVSTVIDRLPPPIGASGAPATTPTAEPAPAPRGPYVGPEPTAPDGGAIVTRTLSTDRAFCATGAQQQQPNPTGWCSAASGPRDVLAGQRVSYSYKLCRAATASDVVLHFTTRQEADFTAQRITENGTQTVWQAGAGARYSSEPHTLAIAAGDCATWTTTWSGQGDDDFAVSDQESYELIAVPWADEFVGDEADMLQPPGSVMVSVRWS